MKDRVRLTVACMVVGLFVVTPLVGVYGSGSNGPVDVQWIEVHEDDVGATGAAVDVAVDDTDDTDDGGGEMARSDEYVKVWGDRVFAQEFTPYVENLTAVELDISYEYVFTHVGCQDKRWQPAGTIVDLFHLFFGGGNSLFRGIAQGFRNRAVATDGIFLGDLTLSIRETLDGDDLISKTISLNYIRQGNTRWELDEPFTLVIPADHPYYWYNEEYGSKPYYLVVSADGGHDGLFVGEYYKVGLSDLDHDTDWDWKEGQAWQKIADIWTTESEDVAGKNLAMAIDGNLAYEEGDGVTNHYNLFVGGGDVARGIGEELRGEYTYIRMQSLNPGEVKRVYRNIESELDAKSDEDDIIVFMIGGDGGPCKVNNVKGEEMGNRFDRMKTEGTCLIFDACFSAQFTTFNCRVLGEDRVILTSCKYNEYASVINTEFCDATWAFSYYIYKAVKAGKDTAEEVFAYAKEHVEDGMLFDYTPGESHPQMFDRYPAENPSVANLPI